MDVAQVDTGAYPVVEYAVTGAEPAAEQETANPENAAAAQQAPQAEAQPVDDPALGRNIDIRA